MSESLVEVELPEGMPLKINGIPVSATEGTKVMCHPGNVKMLFEKPVYSDPGSAAGSISMSDE